VVQGAEAELRQQLKSMGLFQFIFLDKTRGVFLDVAGTKSLGLLLHAIHRQIHQHISTATAENGLCLHYFPLKEALFFFLLRIFPIETTIRNTSTGGKPARKPYHP
jgi:hypothetical protein